MKFNLIINPTHNWQQSVQHSLLLLKSMIDDGHDVLCVFFYGDAARIASDALIQDQWKGISSDLKLLICSTMIDELNIKHDNLPEAFQISGMASLINDMSFADKNIEIS